MKIHLITFLYFFDMIFTWEFRILMTIFVWHHLTSNFKEFFLVLIVANNDNRRTKVERVQTKKRHYSFKLWHRNNDYTQYNILSNFSFELFCARLNFTGNWPKPNNDFCIFLKITDWNNRRCVNCILNLDSTILTARRGIYWITKISLYKWSEYKCTFSAK